MTSPRDALERIVAFDAETFGSHYLEKAFFEFRQLARAALDLPEPVPPTLRRAELVEAIYRQTLPTPGKWTSTLQGILRRHRVEHFSQLDVGALELVLRDVQRAGARMRGGS